MAAAEARVVEAARRSVLEGFRETGAREWVRVDGPSMRPLVPPGSWLLVEFGARRPGVGDIVLAALDGRTVAHRVVAAPTRRRGARYVVKGDAEAQADRRLGPEHIFGIARAVRRPDGHVSTRGCAGVAAHAIGVTSRLAGRLARIGLGWAGHLPRPVGAPIGAAVAFATRAPVLVLAITALAGASIESAREGGDTHGDL